MVVVGGLGTVHGAVYGAILIGFLEASISILKDVLPPAIGNQPGWSRSVRADTCLVHYFRARRGLWPVA